MIGGPHRDSRLDYVHDARYLASRGIAVLAYDVRGRGGSEGSLSDASFDHLAGDAVAAARFLRARPEIDSLRVGVWGTGEGGWIAPLVASRDSLIAFVILVSAPVVSPLDQLTFQRTGQLVAHGMKRPEAEAQSRLRRRIWEFWLAPPGTGTPSSDSLRLAFETARKQGWFASAVVSRDLPEVLIPDEGMGTVNHPARAWLVKDMPAFWSLRHDPVGALKGIRVPILAIYGEKDTEVPVLESIANFRAALGRAAKRRGVVRSFPGADHALQVRSGPGWFAKLAPAPGYRDTILTWIGRVERIKPVAKAASASSDSTAPSGSRASSPKPTPPAPPAVPKARPTAAADSSRRPAAPVESLPPRPPAARESIRGSDGGD